VDRWDGNIYRRAVPISDAVADVAVRQTGPLNAPRLLVAVTTDAPLAHDPVAHENVHTEATTVLRRLLGLEVDLEPFYLSSQRDPEIRPLTDRFRGLKPPRFATLFESLVNAVACQQLTLTVGIELLNRLAATFGRLAPGTSHAHAFPDARDIAKLSPESLRRLGFSMQKSNTIIELANQIVRATLRVDEISKLNDDAATSALRELRGIGRWSAEYVLLRGLGRLQVFPGDDVGARNNLRNRFGIRTTLDYAAVRRITNRWAPYSGLIYFHLLLAGIDDSGWLEADT
jgi:DNA-3-methyladenine glycosylase II